MHVSICFFGFETVIGGFVVETSASCRVAQHIVRGSPFVFDIFVVAFDVNLDHRHHCFHQVTSSFAFENDKLSYIEVAQAISLFQHNFFLTMLAFGSITPFFSFLFLFFSFLFLSLPSVAHRWISWCWMRW
jgi:hypothetical protein